MFSILPQEYLDLRTEELVLHDFRIKFCGVEIIRKFYLSQNLVPTNSKFTLSFSQGHIKVQGSHLLPVFQK